METGIVKWFDAREGKKFGFVTDENGKEIFFHFNDGRPIRVNVTKRRPEFSNIPTVQTSKGNKRLREPKQEDTIVFVRTQSSKGDKASPWCRAILPGWTMRPSPGPSAAWESAWSARRKLARRWHPRCGRAGRLSSM